ncbi:hypothetical protein IYR97_25430 (plasmid) [Pseudomonas fulva]|uniref:Sel1 repeat family protein n=3 Tax=Pseudomonas TaxID=286 RepID=A0A1X0ZR72_PSEPU|nr:MULTISPECIES: hypothetical protein [Pseudomonas]MCT8162723.1 hypothetical protein [Pseudomonas sp. HD6422]MCT8181508.1 hypothetical protein [Pseudomonas sp. HD6421]MDH1928900.1 hypothetical protein [Pseudomonas sp. GD03696]MDM1712568.1 hypothetical protein [Pseudomonas sp. 165]ORL52048.1 hypothetical protein B7H18_08420 [Pseudomonas putida]
MSLAKTFETAKNLGVLTEGWLKHVKGILKENPADIGIKLQLDSAASIVAPAALVATVVSQSGLTVGHDPIRVLLIGSDPLIRFDNSKWASLAGEMLGSPGAIDILLTVDEDAASEFSQLASALDLEPCGVITHEEASSESGPQVDLAIWVHPAGESSDPGEQQNTTTAIGLASQRGVPVYTASFNEVDLHAQNYLIHEQAWQMVPLGGAIERGSKAINKFGISTADLGVEGGWGAILGKLEVSLPTLSEVEISLVRTAMRLVCAEGALHTSWTLGQRINGVAFNRIIPVGLLGNMAIDPQTGHILQQDEDSRELRLIGHLWQAALERMPISKRDLLPWACRLKLAFLSELPKEDERRKEAVATLEEGFRAGVFDAGVALARCYEGSKADGSSAKAVQWHREVGDRHPLSAYSLAYQALEEEDYAAAEIHLRASSAFGYPVAMTDLGKLLCSTDREGEGLQLLGEAADLKDPEANYELGEVSAKAGELQNALNYLRQAWTYGHAEAAGLAAQVAQYMLDHGIGKRSLIKREVKEISTYQKKLDRRQVSNAH